MQHVPYDAEDDEDDDDSDLDVRISGQFKGPASHRVRGAKLTAIVDSMLDRIRQTALANPSANDYPSSDEESDSLANRKRRLHKSYITSHAGARKEEAARRRPAPPIEEDGCGSEEGGEGRRVKRSFFKSRGLDLGRLTEPDPLLYGRAAFKSQSVVDDWM